MLLANASASAAASPVDAMIPSSCQLVVVTTSTGTSGPRNAEKYLVTLERPPTEYPATRKYREGSESSPPAPKDLV